METFIDESGPMFQHFSYELFFVMTPEEMLWHIDENFQTAKRHVLKKRSRPVANDTLTAYGAWVHPVNKAIREITKDLNKKNDPQQVVWKYIYSYSMNRVQYLDGFRKSFLRSWVRTKAMDKRASRIKDLIEKELRKNGKKILE